MAILNRGGLPPGPPGEYSAEPEPESLRDHRVLAFSFWLAIKRYESNTTNMSILEYYRNIVAHVIHGWQVIYLGGF